MAPPSLLRAPRVCSPDGLASLAPILLARWDGGAPRQRTEVRIGHDGERLAVRFDAWYERLHLDASLPRDRPAPRLWEHDVVELFVAGADDAGAYREVEVSPLGQWLCLAFRGPRRPAPGDWRPPLLVAATIAPATFTVELRLPLAAIAAPADGAGPPSRLGVGLYRIAGPGPEREHYAHAALPGAVPDFHRPELFAPLTLE